jgi:hypothetical protein
LGQPGFLSYRPDYVVKTYSPCSILTAPTGNIEDINEAIRRDAHVLEFTAIKSFTGGAAQAYLKGKLPNYVEVVREQ